MCICICWIICVCKLMCKIKVYYKVFNIHILFSLLSCIYYPPLDCIIMCFIYIHLLGWKLETVVVGLGIPYMYVCMYPNKAQTLVLLVPRQFEQLCMYISLQLLTVHLCLCATSCCFIIFFLYCLSFNPLYI